MGLKVTLTALSFYDLFTQAIHGKEKSPSLDSPSFLSYIRLMFYYAFAKGLL